MRSRIIGSLSYANVMATLAVVLSLGGVSYAAIKLGKNSVKSRNIANNAVTSSKIKNGAVTLGKIAGSAQSALHGATGLTGPQGPKGATGPTGPSTGAAGGDLTGNYPSPTVNVTLPAPTPLTPGTNWSGTTTDGQPALSCYEDREGIVHFIGGIHSAIASASTTMATLPAACPPPPADLVVQVPGNLVAPAMNYSTAPYIIPITIGKNGSLTELAGIAGNGTDSQDNLSMDSITYRAR